MNATMRKMAKTQAAEPRFGSINSLSARRKIAGISPRFEKSCRRGVKPGGRGLQTVREYESEDHRGKGDTFNQGGGNQHVGADSSGGFGLPGDSFARLTADLANASASADDGQTHSDHGAADAHSLV